ncbi:MAG: hypothetical protein ACXWQQ_15050 [Pseudobdellovibrio sp.]
MKMRSVFIAMMMFFASILAQAQDAAGLVTQVRSQYQQRFDSQGHYINNPQLQAQFIANQNAAIAKLRASGFVKRSVTVNNNFMDDLVVTISIVQQNGLFAGLLVERNKYDNKSDEEQLRLFDIPLLLKGMSVLNYNGVSMVSINSTALTPEQGGEIGIRYPTDYKKNTFAVAHFEVLKTTAGDVSFFTPARKSFGEVDLDVWFNIFSQDFGISGVTFQ